MHPYICAMPYIIIYKFKGIDDLYCDEQGNFFYRGKPARKVYNRGSIAVLCGRSKRGIIKLRSLAYKSTLFMDDCPF